MLYQVGDDTQVRPERDIDAIVRENQRLRQLLDAIPSMCYVLDWEGRVMMGNEAAARFCGRNTDELPGLTLTDILAPQDIERAVANTRQTMKGNEPAVFPHEQFTDAQGVRRTFHFNEIPFTDPATGRRCVMGVGTDMTDRERFEQQRRQRERIERDLEVAREIQRALLPRSAPHVDGFQIAGWSEAAEQTGGDYYDWLPLPDGRIVLSLADVSGHGIGPALVTSVCRAYARATIDGHAPLRETVSRINRLLHEDLPPGRFVTFVVAVLDPAAATLSMLSAGHGPLLHYMHGEQRVANYNSQGIPLAVDRDIALDEPITLNLSPGDALVVVSDGFFERTNGLGEQFCIQRLVEAVQRHHALDADRFIDAIRSDVTTFAAGAPQQDDMTAIVVQRAAL